MNSSLATFFSTIGNAAAVFYGLYIFRIIDYGHKGYLMDTTFRWFFFKIGSGGFILSLILSIIFCALALSKKEKGVNTALVLTGICVMSFLILNFKTNFFVFELLSFDSSLI
jgi:4-amino-4-deoxy-L-arabinose transferase-like glycosyltransferase